jgi:hypothetical protein
LTAGKEGQMQKMQERVERLRERVKPGMSNVGADVAELAELLAELMKDVFHLNCQVNRVRGELRELRSFRRR